MKEPLVETSRRAHDRTGAATGVSSTKRRLAEDTVPPMYPHHLWACTVSEVPPPSATNSPPLFDRYQTTDESFRFRNKNFD